MKSWKGYDFECSSFGLTFLTGDGSGSCEWTESWKSRCELYKNLAGKGILGNRFPFS